MIQNTAVDGCTTRSAQGAARKTSSARKCLRSSINTTPRNEIRHAEERIEVRLKLRREWLLGERIGKGGFGQVYEARSSGAEPAVAKLVPKSPGAQRELLFVELSAMRNVVPIIDSGETEDSWVLVMPRAQRSLRQHLEQAGGALDTPDAVQMLRDVATALVDLDGKVVHRDLK